VTGVKNEKPDDADKNQPRRAAKEKEGVVMAGELEGSQGYHNHERK
jgi:hypothetical protein